MRVSRKVKKGGARTKVSKKSKGTRKVGPNSRMNIRGTRHAAPNYTKNVMAQMKEITADRYLKSIQKFLEKLVKLPSSKEKEELHSMIALEIQANVSEKMRDYSIEIKERNTSEVFEFIADLDRIIRVMIQEYKKMSNQNDDKMNLEIVMFSLANLIKKSIEDTKDFYRDYTKNTAKKDDTEILADLLSGMSLKKPEGKKNNIDLSHLFSKMGL